MPPPLLHPRTKRVLESLVPFLATHPSFYLAGGTGLALQLGHRQSVDLDFFSSQPWDSRSLKTDLTALGSLSVRYEDAKTLDGALDDVKISFFAYPYPLLFPVKSEGGIPLADERDIAAMKLDVVSSRGSRKDFVDLYFLLKKHTIFEIFGFFQKKYQNISYNKVHIVKSLAYFEDAEQDPDPLMVQPASWDEVKTAVLSAAKQLLPAPK